MTADRKNGTLDWDTSFDTAQGLMIHTFAAGIKVITNIESGYSRIMRRGEVIGEVIADGETIPVGEYEKRLIKIAEQAEKLKAFRQ